MHIVCILDRSGSMQHLTGDTIGGYNSFIDKQRQEVASAVVTTVLFDHQYEILYSDKPIKDMAALTEKEYFARGSTALLDAVGRTVLQVDGDFKKNGTCPKSELVIFMIMTDGLENASREFSRAAVRKLVSDAQGKVRLAVHLHGRQHRFRGRSRFAGHPQRSRHGLRRRFQGRGRRL